MWFFIYSMPDSFWEQYAAKNLIFVYTKVVFHPYKSPSLRMYSWFVLLNYDSFHFFHFLFFVTGFFPLHFLSGCMLNDNFFFFHFRFVDKIFNFRVDLTYFPQRNFISGEFLSFSLHFLFTLFVHKYPFVFNSWKWWW